MNEKQSKASDLVEDLMTRGLAREEIAKRYPEAPKLRLRPDTPTIEIDSAKPAKDLIDQLRSERLDTVAVREAGADAAAVLLPVERYLELVGNELARRRDDLVMGPHGDFRPQRSALDALHVEQIDPNDTWPQAAH